jgi:hypothetical protein
MSSTDDRPCTDFERSVWRPVTPTSTCSMGADTSVSTSVLDRPGASV